MKRAAVAFLAAASLAAALSSCGSKADVGDRISGKTLTVYASVPMHGASSVNARAVLNGARLALSQIRGRIGKYRIVLKVLDDSTVQRGQWDPGQTTVNAHLAVADKTTVGYIGEFNSGASAISIPILNRAGIAQISPASTAVGLTSQGSGASPGEPQKYYPTGVRTYARIVPNDAIQAIAQVKLQKSVGCHKTYVVDDGEVDGADTASSFALAAQAAGLHVLGVQAFEPSATDYSSLATGVAQTGADCVLISAITESNAVLVTKQIAAALPDAKLFATAGVAESTYTDPAQGGIPIALDPRVMVTAADAWPERFSPCGQPVLLALRAQVRDAGAVRDLRLRGDEPDAERDRARPPITAREAGAALEGRGRDLLDPRPAERAGHLQHRWQRRHDPAPLRRVPGRGRRVDLLEGDRRMNVSLGGRMEGLAAVRRPH